MGEFELIERFFKRNQAATPAPTAPEAPDSIALGIGDDCALLQPAPGMQLAVSTDLLVEGRHFFADVDPAALGHKALAVNLSDLAAMGAEPLAFTLALALPPERAQDEAWLAALAQGLFALADAHGCALVGGDTTAGPLNICVTIFGEVPAGQALLRGGARAGDDIWVSGRPGEARLALDALRGQMDLPAATLARLRARLERPTPRVALGLALRGLASSAIDVSDGLLGDLGHVLKSSRVGAEIDVHITTDLLASGALQENTKGIFDAETMMPCALAGGDDYELVFTAPAARRAAVQAASSASGTQVTRIGRITPAPGLRLLDRTGQPLPGRFASFDHFA